MGDNELLKQLNPQEPKPTSQTFAPEPKSEPEVPPVTMCKLKIVMNYDIMTQNDKKYDNLMMNMCKATKITKLNPPKSNQKPMKRIKSQVKKLKSPNNGPQPLISKFLLKTKTRGKLKEDSPFTKGYSIESKMGRAPNVKLAMNLTSWKQPANQRKSCTERKLIIPVT